MCVLEEQKRESEGEREGEGGRKKGSVLFKQTPSQHSQQKSLSGVGAAPGPYSRRSNVQDSGLDFVCVLFSFN